MYRNTQFRTKTQSTFRMKEVDSSLLVRLHRSIKVTDTFKIAHARLTCVPMLFIGHWHDGVFLSRGYARAYHESLQGQGYANESLAHS